MADAPCILVHGTWRLYKVIHGAVRVDALPSEDSSLEHMMGSRLDGTLVYESQLRAKLPTYHRWHNALPNGATTNGDGGNPIHSSLARTQF